MAMAMGFIVNVLNARHHMFGKAQDALACCRQDYGRTIAFNELHAQAPLKDQELGAQGRLAHTRLLSGQAEVSSFAQGHEILELSQGRHFLKLAVSLAVSTAMRWSPDYKLVRCASL
jgi:hypothetical protein